MTAKPKRKATRSKPETANQKKQVGNTSRGNLNRIGALWINEGRNGKFMSGRIELAEDAAIRILVFKNGFKDEPNQPDYIIYEPESAEDTAAREQQARGKGRATHSDDDIPF